MSAAESALFGLTEEQRLAKEEEERNVALVEIQLRDENSFPALGVSWTVLARGHTPGSQPALTGHRPAHKHCDAHVFFTWSAGKRGVCVFLRRA